MVPPAGGGGGEQRQAQQRQSRFGPFGITSIIQIAVFWYLNSIFFSYKKPSDPALLMSNIFQKGEHLDMWLYLSEHEIFNQFGSVQPIWHETNIPYAVWAPESTRTLSLNYCPSETLKNNGSLYAHTFFVRSGYTPDPNDPEYQPLAAFGRMQPIVVHFPKSKSDQRKHLLGNIEGSDKVEKVLEFEDVLDDGPTTWISYWKPNITINLVEDFSRYPRDAAAQNAAPYLNVDPQTGDYFPTIYFNEFWLLREKLIAINETVKELPLHLEMGPISLNKWKLFSYVSMLESKADELKRGVYLE